MKKVYIILALLLLPVLAWGQAKTFLPFPVTSSNGRPINDADVDLYKAGTTTKQADLTYLKGSGGWYYWTGDTLTVPSGNYDVYVNGILWRSNVKLNVTDQDIKNKIYGNTSATDTVAKRGLWKIVAGDGSLSGLDKVGLYKHAVNQRVLNVLDYGVKTDGSDASTIVKAILDTVSSRTTLYFPKGIYTFNSALDTIKSTKTGIKILGDGIGKTVFNYEYGGATFLIVFGDSTSIEGITVYSNKAAQIIFVQNNNYFELVNCYLELIGTNVTNTIAFDGAKHNVIERCVIKNDNVTNPTSQAFAVINHQSTLWGRSNTFIYDSYIVGSHYTIQGTEGAADIYIYGGYIVNTSTDQSGGCDLCAYRGTNYHVFDAVLVSDKPVFNWNQKNPAYNTKYYINGVEVYAKQRVIFTEDTVNSVSQKDSIIFVNSEVWVDSLWGWNGLILPHTNYYEIRNVKFYMTKPDKYPSQKGLFSTYSDDSSHIVLHNVEVRNMSIGEFWGAKTWLEIDGLKQVIDFNDYDVFGGYFAGMNNKSYIRNSQFISNQTLSGGWSGGEWHFTSNVDSAVQFQNVTFISKKNKYTLATFGNNFTFLNCNFIGGRVYLDDVATPTTYFVKCYFQHNPSLSQILSGTGTAYLTGCTTTSTGIGVNVTLKSGSIWNTSNFYEPNSKVLK